MTENDITLAAARTLFEQKNFVASLALFEQLALASPNDAAAHYNLGVVLAKLNRIEDALSCYRKALSLNPTFTDAYINFGFCLNEVGLVAQARKGFALARSLSPDHPSAVLNEGIAALALGDYKSGWRDFSARWHLPAYAAFKRTYPSNEWRGEEISGKTLFLYPEQGFGDTLQMIRFIPLLIEKGIKIIAEMPPALSRLIKQQNYQALIIEKGEVTPAFDYYCALMDIPGALGITLENLPAPISYIKASKTSPHMPGLKKRVGLSWAGRSSHENDFKRSLPLNLLRQIFERSDIEWVSLQKIVPEKDSEILSQYQVSDDGRHFADFADTAASITGLDMVIAVDSAVAHLAGALGKTVWVPLPFYSDWRWMMDREDSPWYPSAKLFRQKVRGDWSPVIAEISRQL